MTYANRIMPSSIVDGFASRLQVGSFGVVGTTIFKDKFPTTPSNCVLIRSDGGAEIVGAPMIPYVVQVLVRNSADRTGQQLTEAIYSSLSRNGFQVYSGFQGRCTPRSTPGLRYTDENGRFVYSLSFDFTGLATLSS